MRRIGNPSVAFKVNKIAAFRIVGLENADQSCSLDLSAACGGPYALAAIAADASPVQVVHEALAGEQDRESAWVFIASAVFIVLCIVSVVF